MERLRESWKPTYEPLEDEDEREDASSPKAQRVSQFEYFVFLSLGVAIWSMFIACATYFQCRFAENEFLLNNFQSLILVVSTITNLGSAVYLSYCQKSANYPWRICASLVINCAVFMVLTLSAVMFQVGPEVYITVLLACVLCTSWGTGLKIVSVLAAPQSLGTQGSMVLPKSTLIYFPTATFVSCSCLLLFLLLLSRHCISPHKSGSGVLLKKPEFLSFAIWLCFLVTMIFLVHTQVILSVHLEDTSPRMFKLDVFISIGFTCDRLKLLALVSIAQLVYIPSYIMYNIKGHGAFMFEMSNGWVGSNVMMSIPGWVGDDEKEASGGFMEMCLVAGLATGSFASFLIVNV
ncbi:hypothetical protein C7212DRAFT_354330 [Tuber magnatum]|uniref:Nucleoside transporter n=1 Tax=Tuber magnatum TaxID=42249 RepID=A0A317SHJ1_9PEZI|nr:hypothetical protein C7212DRAFT_354330 [Tuber magnatum]